MNESEQHSYRPDISVFDPREGRGQEWGLRQGRMFSSLSSHTLVVDLDRIDADANIPFLRDLLHRYQSDHLLVLVAGANKKFMRKLESYWTGGKLRRYIYTHTFAYSSENIDLVTRCTRDIAMYEDWVFALVRRDALPNIADIDFAADFFAWEKVWENLSLFNLVVLYNFDTNWIEICFRLPEHFDDLISFTATYPFSPAKPYKRITLKEILIHILNKFRPW